MILESHASIKATYGDSFHIFEIISIIIFSAEYIYRIAHASYKEGTKGAFAYIFSLWFDRSNFYFTILLEPNLKDRR